METEVDHDGNLVEANRVKMGGPGGVCMLSISTRELSVSEGECHCHCL